MGTSQSKNTVDVSTSPITTRIQSNDLHNMFIGKTYQQLVDVVNSEDNVFDCNGNITILVEQFNNTRILLPEKFYHNTITISLKNDFVVSNNKFEIGCPNNIYPPDSIITYIHGSFNGPLPSRN